MPTNARHRRTAARTRASSLASLAVVVVVVVVAAGCGGSSSTSTTSTSTVKTDGSAPAVGVTGSTPPGSAATVAVPRSTCAPAKPFTAPPDAVVFPFGGLDRTYLISVPADYDGTKGTPFLFNLHGSGSNKEQQVAYSELPKKGSERGYIVVTPDGTGKPQGWNMFRTEGQPDDYAFIDALFRDLDSKLCIDPNRVYTTGISNGSAFSGFLTCVEPFRFAAVAMVAATVPAGNCPADVHPSAIAFHGTEDPIVPYGGGDVAASAARGNQTPGAEMTMSAFWAKVDGCDPEPKVDRPWEHVKRLTFEHCLAGHDVVFYSIEGGGHTWPGSVVDLTKLGITALGASSNEAHASDLMLDFFDSHPRPTPGR